MTALITEADYHAAQEHLARIAPSYRELGQNKTGWRDLHTLRERLLVEFGATLHAQGADAAAISKQRRLLSLALLEHELRHFLPLHRRGWLDGFDASTPGGAYAALFAPWHDHLDPATATQDDIDAVYANLCEHFPHYAAWREIPQEAAAGIEDVILGEELIEYLNALRTTTGTAAPTAAVVAEPVSSPLPQAVPPEPALARPHKPGRENAPRPERIPEKPPKQARPATSGSIRALRERWRWQGPEEFRRSPSWVSTIFCWIVLSSLSMLLAGAIVALLIAIKSIDAQAAQLVFVSTALILPTGLMLATRWLTGRSLVAWLTPRRWYDTVPGLFWFGMYLLLMLAGAVLNHLAPNLKRPETAPLAGGAALFALVAGLVGYLWHRIERDFPPSPFHAAAWKQEPGENNPLQGWQVLIGFLTIGLFAFIGLQSFGILPPVALVGGLCVASLVAWIFVNGSSLILTLLAAAFVSTVLQAMAAPQPALLFAIIAGTAFALALKLSCTLRRQRRTWTINALIIASGGFFLAYFPAEKPLAQYLAGIAAPAARPLADAALSSFVALTDSRYGKASLDTVFGIDEKATAVRMVQAKNAGKDRTEVSLVLSNAGDLLIRKAEFSLYGSCALEPAMVQFGDGLAPGDDANIEIALSRPDGCSESEWEDWQKRVAWGSWAKDASFIQVKVVEAEPFDYKTLFRKEALTWLGLREG